LLIAHPDLLAVLPGLPASWTLRVERADERRFAGRLVWEQRVLPRLAERWRADVLLSFGSFVPLHGPCPSVLEAGNALPFTRAYWELLRGEPLRVRLEEYARWELLRASLRTATRVLTPTRAMRQDVVASLPELAPRIDVALWGVAAPFHERRWRPPAGQQATILGVSKHGLNKEFDVLVRAVAQLRRRWPGVRLVLTGTVDESRWSLRTFALARQLGLAEHVCFAGDVPNRQLPELICQARLLAFPTWCESFGLPLAEALAMGAPAVAANIPACREVGEDAAAYYRPGDAGSLADAIDDLLASPERAQALAERAAARGQAFSWRANAVAVRQTLLKAAA
jgi:glycosyltransferase involved in cell wall biosynthesis